MKTDYKEGDIVELLNYQISRETHLISSSRKLPKVGNKFYVLSQYEDGTGLILSMGEENDFYVRYDQVALCLAAEDKLETYPGIADNLLFQRS